MEKLLSWTGIVWVIIGLIVTLYSLFVSIPRLSSTLSVLMSASPYGQLFDPTAFRAFMSGLVVFSGVNAFVIPGLLLAGVGTIIRLLRVPRS